MIVQASSLNKAAPVLVYRLRSPFSPARFKLVPSIFCIARPGTAYICVVVRHEISLPAIYISGRPRERLSLERCRSPPDISSIRRVRLLRLVRTDISRRHDKRVRLFRKISFSCTIVSSARLDLSLDLSSAVAAHLT